MANASVIIDPKELREFTSQLKQFNAELNNSSTRLQSRFRRLGETWRDPAYAKFAQEFEQTVRLLNQFQRTSDEVIPRLLQLADRVESVHR
ncbi:MAG: WXG100 family type VII secretion target [Chloroflexi bacterium]|nr:WXG100 family type VII secretion target [Chloroflexota bacterium]